MDLLPEGTRFGLMRHMISSPPPHRDYVGAYARRDGGSDDDTALNGAALTGALPREHIGDLEKAHGCWAAELDGGSAAPAN